MSSKILVVHRNPVIHKVVSQAFASEQTDLVWASNGELAKGLLNEVKPDLLIAEFLLPRLTGFELCQHAKDSAHLGHIPVILLDSQFDLMNQAVAQGAGADAYIADPFEAVTLVEVARNLLKNGAGNNQPALAPAIDPDDAQSLNARIAVEEMNAPDEQAHAPEPEVEATPYVHPGEQAIATPRRKRVVIRSRKGRSRDNRMFWATLAAVVVIAVVILIQQSPRIQETPSAEQPEIIRPEISLFSPPGEQSQTEASSITSMAFGATSVSADNVQKNNPVDAGVEDRSSDEADLASASDNTGSPSDASATQDNDSTRSEVTRITPSISEPQSSPAVSSSSREQPITRARRARSARSTDSGNHMIRAGRELKLAGKHMGSGIKHVGQGSVAGARWSGKKIGRGFARFGKALKKPF